MEPWQAKQMMYGADISCCLIVWHSMESPLPLVLTKARDRKRPFQKPPRLAELHENPRRCESILGLPCQTRPTSNSNSSEKKWLKSLPYTCQKALHKGRTCLHLQPAFTLPPGKVLFGWCPGHRGEHAMYVREQRRGSVTQMAPA